MAPNVKILRPQAIKLLYTFAVLFADKFYQIISYGFGASFAYIFHIFAY
jgi:hypothetical protein